MTLFTPKNFPWQATKGYETVDAYQVPTNPIISQRTNPCYIPKGMVTKALKFPNLSTGFNRSPIHEARVALNTRYSAEKWLDNLKSIRDEVCSNLEESKVINKKLDELVSKEKNKLLGAKNIDDLTKWTQETALACMICKVDELSSEQEKIIKEIKNMQDCKRKLQACLQGIEAPLQISQECLCHREFRTKSDLIHDEVEKMLMNEAALFRQCQMRLEKYVEQCDEQLRQGRKMQNDWEKFIKSMNWIVRIEKLDIKIKKYFESKIWEKESECLKKHSNTIVTGSTQLLKQIEKDMDETVKEVAKAWNKTNEAFVKKCDQMKNAIDELKNGSVKIKNEIFNVEKNLKYLKSNKELKNELQQGKDLLESLLRTQVNLESELSSKINSYFMDKQKCMTMRKCYPISIITKL